MKRLGAVLAVASLLAAAQADAAGRYSESFSAGASAAPLSGLSLGIGTWSFTGGVAQIVFSDSGYFAVPDLATLRPAAAAFTGDFVAAGVELIGFRYRAEHHAPSSLYLEISGGSSVFQRVLSPPPVGVWAYYMVPLTDAAGGGWTAKRGNIQDFAAALRDVKSVEMKVRRSGVATQAHTIDDLFVDGLPEAAGGTGAPGAGTMTVGWDALQSGMPYVLQASESLTGSWSDVGPVVPTNRLHHVEISVSGPGLQFFRLRAP